MSDDELIKHEGGAIFVKDTETGEVLAVERDERYTNWSVEFWAAECKHEKTEIMRIPVAGGSIQVRACCTTCGDRVGNAMSQKDSAWVQTLPIFSGDTSTSYQTRRHAERHTLLLNLARTQYQERGKFTKTYKQYLQSPEWRAKRDLVFKRSGGLCEGCGTAKATEAHHRTYQHFGNEFLFELLALCHACHERIHADDAPEADNDSEGYEDFDEPDDIEYWGEIESKG